METPTSKHDFSSTVSDARTGSRHRSSATTNFCIFPIVVRMWSYAVHGPPLTQVEDFASAQAM
ncbi:UNVERIFIED_CONTAM: hypothetical protein Sindi_1420100, partial [Sesamum indicum]